MAITDGYHCVCVMDRIISKFKSSGDAETIYDLESVRSFVIEQHQDIVTLNNRIANLKTNFKRAVENTLAAVEE
jgi:hypothetical protein